MHIPVQVNWSAHAYCDDIKHADVGVADLSREKECRRSILFPPLLPRSTPIDFPCVIVDQSGIVLAWYLPDILTSAMKVSRSQDPIWMDTDQLNAEGCHGRSAGTERYRKETSGGRSMEREEIPVQRARAL